MTQFRFLRLYFATKLSSVGTNRKDGHGLKIERFHAVPAKITPKELSWLVLPGEICFISSL